MATIETWLAEAPKFCQQTGRPLVTISYAQSLDGSLTAQPGKSLTISGQESMRITHALRAAHDAILVGLGTVLVDNPQLTVRLVEGKNPQPIVLDSKLRIPITAKLFEHPKGVWIAAGGELLPERVAAVQEKGAEILYSQLDATGQVSLDDLLAALAERGICSLMVEGGREVISRFLRQELVDQIVLTIAPMLVGGLHLQMQDETDEWTYPLADVGYARLGEDLIVYGRPKQGA